MVVITACGMSWKIHAELHGKYYHLLALYVLKHTHNFVKIMPRTFVGNCINTRVFQEPLFSQFDESQMKTSTLKPCWNTSIPTTRAAAWSGLSLQKKTVGNVNLLFLLLWGCRKAAETCKGNNSISTLCE